MLPDAAADWVGMSAGDAGRLLAAGVGVGADEGTVDAVVGAAADARAGNDDCEGPAHAMSTSETASAARQ